MPIPHYLRRATAGLFVTGAIFVGLPPVLRIIDPAAGSFGIELLNALGLAAMLFGAVLHLALVAYQAESLDGEGKLFENVTAPLEAALEEHRARTYDPDILLRLQVESRQTAQFKFLVRCVRLSFCLLSLAYLLHLALQVVTVALTVVPQSVPAL